ncbi:MAG: patatin-like phospholipase family protein [Steroidobacteraceae bacterium]
MSFGLVLGGGGAVGIAWEIGVLAALEEAGASVRGAAVVVGTSAGSIVGAQVFGGRPFSDMLAEMQDTSEPAQMQQNTGAMPRANVSETFEVLAGVGDARERGRKLGEFALSRPDPFPEAMYLAMIGHLIKVQDWPTQTRFLPTGVDCKTGERVAFERTQGVPFVAAVATSCCVPGLVPAVTINGRRYIDGGVDSPSNLDVVLGTGVDRVLFIGPFGGEHSPPLGRAVELLQSELAMAEKAGLRTLSVTPSPSFAAKVGVDFLNTSLRPASVACGLEDGRNAVARVKQFLA